MDTTYSNEESGRRTRVLVVDDEDSLRNSLYRNLESDGYEVLAASNPVDALSICHKSVPPVELLVTDCNLPQMTGLELARECLRLNSKLSILYISGSHPDGGLRSGLESGKCGFLAKPFRKDELLRKARELLLMDPATLWPSGRNLA